MNPTTDLVNRDLTDEDSIDLLALLHNLVQERWLIIGVATLATLLGGAYALFSAPVYESNILLQIDDKSPSGKALFGDAAELLDNNTAAKSEIEMIRSRLVVGQAVDQLQLNVSAAPRYFPVVGEWMARQNAEMSNPGLWGWGGYVWGAENLKVQQLSLPAGLTRLQLSVQQGTENQYVVTLADKPQTYLGHIGQPLTLPTRAGNATLVISQINARPGAVFDVSATSRLQAIEELQRSLQVTEIGKQSNVLRASLRDTDPDHLAQVLNAVGNTYIAQHVRRKTEEAEKSLSFLNEQLPQLRQQLEQAESAYNSYRKNNNSVNLEGEAKALLEHSVSLEEKQQQLRQKRQELLTRYAPKHPNVQALDAMLAQGQKDMQALLARVRQLPTVEQGSWRLERDVKVSTTLYTSLLQTEQQLMLVKAGKVGNVRLVDYAVVPEIPVQPKRGVVVALSLLLGTLAGCIIVVLRHNLRNRLHSPEALEAISPMPVLATLLHSREQTDLEKTPNPRQAAVLANSHPHSPTVEGLRSLMTALQFTWGGQTRGVLAVTGLTESIGKSFLTVNLATLLAQNGRKVLVMDADMRMGHLHTTLRHPATPGVSEWLGGQAELNQVVRRQVLPGIDFIPRGQPPGDPVQLLGQSRLAAGLGQLREQYDLVLLDCPPLLPVTDAIMLCQVADHSLMVARADINTPHEVIQAQKRLQHNGLRPLGWVFNDMQEQQLRYGKAYTYAYAKPPSDRQRANLLTRLWQRLTGDKRKT